MKDNDQRKPSSISGLYVRHVSGVVWNGHGGSGGHGSCTVSTGSSQASTFDLTDCHASSPNLGSSSASLPSSSSATPLPPLPQPTSTHLLMWVTWKVTEPVHSNDWIALYTTNSEGEKELCIDQQSHGVEGIQEGHILWLLDKKIVPNGVKKLCLCYFNGQNGLCLAQTPPLALNHDSSESFIGPVPPFLLFPRAKENSSFSESEVSLSSSASSSSTEDSSAVATPSEALSPLDEPSPSAAMLTETVTSTAGGACALTPSSEYFPIWWKTTGQTIYKFDTPSANVAIYETIFPKYLPSLKLKSQEAPPPLPPRVHKPLTRLNALSFTAEETEQKNEPPNGGEGSMGDEAPSSPPPPPPPPRRQESSNHSNPNHFTLPQASRSKNGGVTGANGGEAGLQPWKTLARKLPSLAERIPQYQKVDSANGEPLPANWEARMDSHGRIFYVDHVHRTTTWQRPTSSTAQNSSELSQDFQQLDRRYQTIRRTIKRPAKPANGALSSSNPSPSPVQTASAPAPPPPSTPAQSSSTAPSPTTQLPPKPSPKPLPALDFLTRTDLIDIMHDNEEALRLYSRSPSLRHMLTRLRQAKGTEEHVTFTRYQHQRDLVTFVNLFAEKNASLPPGWEAKQNRHGKTFFVDHSSQTTTFMDPRLPKAPPPPQPPKPAHHNHSHHEAAEAPKPHRPENLPLGNRDAPDGGSTPAPRASSWSVPPVPPPRPATEGASPVPVSSIPAAYNELVVAFLRQANIMEILTERYPALASNNGLRSQVLGIRAEGTPALDRFSNEIDLNILLSLFEHDIMAYVPAETALNTSVTSPAPGTSSGLVSSGSRPSQRSQCQKSPDFETKLRRFYRKLESKGYRQGPSKWKLHIRRENLLEDAFSKIMGASKKDLQKSKFHTVFAGEEGLDYGGPCREFFFLLSRELFNPYYGLFEYSANDTYTVQLSPMSNFVDNHHQWFRFCGRVLGLALVNQCLVDVFFTRPFYKALLKLPITLSDVESLDAEFHQSLQWLRDTDLNVEGQDLDLTFTVTQDIGGQIVEKELKPGGKQIPVTEKNKKEYIDRMIRWRLERGVGEQTQSLIRGLEEVIEHKLFSVFDARELEWVLAGTAEIDVADWRKHTEYRSGYHDQHQVVQWFWWAIEQLSNEQRLRLLQFITGTSSIPFEGFAALRGSTGPRKFCIEKWGTPDSLPRAHTCFNRLDLPSYPSREILLEKLLLAVEETNTFSIE